MAKFKIGDKVRVLDAEAIKQAVEKGFETGGIYLVSSIDSYGDPRLGVGDDELTLFESELRYIEKVADKPTKNQRISTLEAQVSELVAEVEALKQARKDVTPVINLPVQSDVDVVKIADQLAEMIVGETIKPAPTPNELRKAVIAEARAFVAELTAYINPEAGGYKQEHPKYGMIDRSVYTWIARSFFEVKPDKREVTVVLKPKKLDDVITKAIAKCAPGDVFNADIGKAIALGRALGLDVSKFEQAVQPTEPTVGMKIEVVFVGGRVMGVDVPDKVEKDGDRFLLSRKGEGLTGGGSYTTYRPEDGARIIDDTEAQYE